MKVQCEFSGVLILDPNHVEDRLEPSRQLRLVVPGELQQHDEVRHPTPRNPTVHRTSVHQARVRHVQPTAQAAAVVQRHLSQEELATQRVEVQVVVLLEKQHGDHLRYVHDEVRDRSL